MNWDQIEGNWKQFKGKVKEKWGKLTDDQLEQLAGNRDQLVGRIQEQYGISKEEAALKYKAAMAAKQDLDPDFVICARCDLIGAENGSFEEAVQSNSNLIRLRRYGNS